MNPSEAEVRVDSLQAEAETRVIADQRSDRLSCHRLRRRNILIVLTLVAAVLLGAAPWWLPVVAWVVVAEDPIPGNANGKVYLALGAQHRRDPKTYDTVAQLWQKLRPIKIVLLAPARSRVEEMGIIPPRELLAARELQSRGIPGNSIQICYPRVLDTWDEVRLLKGISEQDQVEVVYCVGQFNTRSVGVVAMRICGKDLRKRIRIIGIADPRYTERDWWQSRPGWKGLFWAFCDLIQTWLFDEPPAIVPLSVQEYKAWVSARMKGASVGREDGREKAALLQKKFDR
jgi:hypothetical protein